MVRLYLYLMKWRKSINSIWHYVFGRSASLPKFFLWLQSFRSNRSHICYVPTSHTHAYRQQYSCIYRFFLCKQSKRNHFHVLQVISRQYQIHDTYFQHWHFPFVFLFVFIFWVKKCKCKTYICNKCLGKYKNDMMIGPAIALTVIKMETMVHMKTIKCLF